MPLVWIGLVLIALKALEVGPAAQVSWWWLATPFVLAFFWFEWGERIAGRDRRQVEHIEWEKNRQERVSKVFEKPGAGKRKRASAKAG